MQKKEYRIASTDQIHSLLVTEWQPTGKPVAVLQVVHGMREHLGRYEDFARYLNAQQVLVVGYDHLGHGGTVDFPDEYGYFGDYHGARHLVKDCTKMTRYFCEKYSDLPFFLLGHSMGSFVSRLSVLHTGHLLNGYICMGTAGRQPVVAITRVFAEALCALRGTQNHTDLANRMMEIYSLRQLAGATSPDAWISRDSQVVAKYRDDPSTQFTFTNQGYADLLDLQIASNQTEWYLRYPGILPILLTSGEQDPVGDFGRDIPLIADKLTAYGATDVNYALYPQARHEILNEINREQVYYDILQWMRAHAPKQQIF